MGGMAAALGPRLCLLLESALVPLVEGVKGPLPKKPRELTIARKSLDIPYIETCLNKELYSPKTIHNKYSDLAIEPIKPNRSMPK